MINNNIRTAMESFLKGCSVSGARHTASRVFTIIFEAVIRSGYEKRYKAGSFSGD